MTKTMEDEIHAVADEIEAAEREFRPFRSLFKSEPDTSDIPEADEAWFRRAKFVDGSQCKYPQCSGTVENGYCHANCENLIFLKEVMN